jgi:formate hydrogenlyase subunit 3/multisubunit Na+/H+ antiporter MnhD subunit
VVETLLTSEWLWLLLIAFPILGAGLLAVAPRLGLMLAPWASLPTLALSLWPIEADVTFTWLVLGSRFGLDDTSRCFLFFTTFLWLATGLYSRAYIPRAEQYRYFAYFLLTLTGNLGLILAHDAVSYYVCFALMSFAAYGLIIHDRTPNTLWAGRVYIILVVVGEALLFVGILALVVAAGSMDFPLRVEDHCHSPGVTTAIALVLIGFGIKVGVVPLHVWLPLAHPAAPTPASAVLSGAIIKAGLLGWLRFLPLGEAAYPEWGSLCVAVGLAAAYYAAIVGVMQSDPKVVLAYSSISQMGIMTVGVGAALIAPAGWPLLLPSLVVYAMHHALAKGVLFLGVGVANFALTSGWQRSLVGVGLLLPALALAGAPLTSGAIAKASLKEGLQAVEAPWSGRLEILLAVAAVGTTVLMARFLYLVCPRSSVGHERLTPGLWLPWLAVLIGVVIGVWLPWPGFNTAAWGQLTADGIGSAVWPIIVGGGLSLAAWSWGRTAGLRIPAGDILVPIVWFVHWLRRTRDLPPEAPLPRYGRRLAAWFRLSVRRLGVLASLRRAESYLLDSATTGLVFLVLLVVLFVALMVG